MGFIIAPKRCPEGIQGSLLSALLFPDISLDEKL
jgi:hypothetical protein